MNALQEKILQLMAEEGSTTAGTQQLAAQIAEGMDTNRCPINPDAIEAAKSLAEALEDYEHFEPFRFAIGVRGNK
jgi:hypothetical protein